MKGLQKGPKKIWLRHWRLYWSSFCCVLFI